MTLRVLILFFLVVAFAYSKPYIVTTVKPLADIAKAVCRENCKVEYIIPPGADVHHYEYKYSDLKKVYSADIFLFIGSGEPQIDKLSSKLPEEKKLPVYKIKGIYLIHSFEFNHHHSHDEEGNHETFHPAVWLDPQNAKAVAKAVYKKLQKIDPQTDYSQNLKEFLKQVDSLLLYGKEKFKNLKKKDFISYHYTYPYFTNRFKLNYIATIQEGHGKKPTIKHLLYIINLIKKRKIPSIFASKQFYNLKYLKLIQKETGVKIVKLDPFGEKTNYTGTMKQLIDKVYQGLKDE